MKRVLLLFKSFFVLCLVFVGSTKCSAYRMAEWQKTDMFINSGIYTYRVVNEADKEIEIRSINSAESKIVIPEVIDGYKVISIGYSNFISHPEYSDLTSACDLAYEDEINALQLKGCADTLSELVIPGGIKYIGAAAFRNFTHLSKITINSELERIYERAFEGCKSLKSINIPTETYLENRVFFGCRKLTKISFSLKNLAWADELFDGGRIKEIHIVKDGISEVERYCYIDMYTFGSAVVDKVVFGRGVKKVVLDRYIRELFIKDKNTVMKTYRASEDIQPTKIRTVKGAKAIRFAKKHKLDYKIMKLSKIK